MWQVLSEYLLYQLRQYPGRGEIIQKSIYKIKFSAKKIHLCKTRNELFLLEASATKSYWIAFSLLARQDSTWNKFYPKADDSLNQALNIGYTMIANVIKAEIGKLELDTSIGILHFPQDQKNALVYDMQELFRQVLVDQAILPLFTRRLDHSGIRPKDVVSNISEKIHENFWYRSQWWQAKNILSQEARNYLASIRKNTLWIPYQHSWAHRNKKSA